MGRALKESSFEVLLNICKTHIICDNCKFYGLDGCQIEFEEGYFLGEWLDMMGEEYE